MKIKSYLLIVFSLIFIAYLFFEYQNSTDKELIKKSFIQKAQATFHEKDDLFNGYINKLENILLSIGKNQYFKEYVSTKRNQEYIKELFLSSMRSIPEIFQLRYIDVDGNEDIRVDRLKNKNYVIIDNKELQNKKHRYYFKQTLEKKDNEIWYSNIDLNMEHNKIVKPILPTLRIGTPVQIDGIKKGILIININIDYFFDKFIKSSNYDIHIVDKDGYFIKHSINKYSWSRYLDLNKTIYNTLGISKKKIEKAQWKSDQYFIKNTSFKNNDKVMVLIETKKSQVDEEIRKKRLSRLLYFFGTVLLILSVGYIVYSKKYTNLLEKHNRQMDEERTKIRNILDSQNSIVILTDGQELVDGNKRFLEFFGFENIEKFKQKHKCICEFFENDDKHEYVQEEIQGQLWALYILLNPQKIHKAKISDIDGKTHIFIVNIKEYDSKNSIEIITFSDITELEYLKNNLEDTVYEKTEELRYLNQNLELRIRDEVEKNREKEKQLFEREKMAQMGDMIGNIAHQWRQPLSTISTCASGIKVQDELDILDKEKLYSSLDVIVRTSQFLSNTIDDFRGFIKEDKEKKVFNIKDTVEQVIKIVKDTYLHNFIELKTQIEDIQIESISGELSQVLLNILNNAKDILLEKEIKDKCVELKVYTNDENMLILTIEDNAGGVPKDILPKIFDPYFTTKHQAAGTGIGLYMSHKIITKNLKGNLYVKNSEMGAKFYIELPLN